MKNESRYAEFVKEKGCPLLGSDELGLKKIDALEAIVIARSDGFPILGGDVYLRSSGRITPAYANWSTEKSNSETVSEYADRSWTEAEVYIKQYREPKDAEVIFVLVVSR